MIGRLELREAYYEQDRYDGSEGPDTEVGTFVMFHNQNCCESVWIEDVTGDVEDIIGETIELADVSSGERPVADGTSTWTFYRIHTMCGDVCIRWVGESNGYYSESVDVVLVKK